MQSFQKFKPLLSSLQFNRMKIIQQPRFSFSVMEKTFLASDLEVKLKKNPTPKPGPEHQYTFGGITTDHMLQIDYEYHNGGWQVPKIIPNEPFMMDPSNATLHYSIECFEGAKAYKTFDD